MSTLKTLLSSKRENNNSIYVLDRTNCGHDGHNDYATCERCSKESFLTEYNGICVCSECLRELQEEQKSASTIEPKGGHKGGHLEEESEKTPTPFVNIKDLDEKGNIKPHKKDDKEFQAKQSREARARMKKEGILE